MTPLQISKYDEALFDAYQHLMKFAVKIGFIANEDDITVLAAVDLNTGQEVHDQYIVAREMSKHVGADHVVRSGWMIYGLEKGLLYVINQMAEFMILNNYPVADLDLFLKHALGIRYVIGKATISVEGYNELIAPQADFFDALQRNVMMTDRRLNLQANDMPSVPQIIYEVPNTYDKFKIITPVEPEEESPRIPPCVGHAFQEEDDITPVDDLVARAKRVFGDDINIKGMLGGKLFIEDENVPEHITGFMINLADFEKPFGDSSGVRGFAEGALSPVTETPIKITTRKIGVSPEVLNVYGIPSRQLFGDVSKKEEDKMLSDLKNFVKERTDQLLNGGFGIVGTNHRKIATMHQAYVEGKIDFNTYAWLQGNLKEGQCFTLADGTCIGNRCIHDANDYEEAFKPNSDFAEEPWTGSISLDDFQAHVMEFVNPALDDREAELNAILGITGEAGELADYVKKAIFHDHDFDADHAAKELGDILFYVAWLANLYGWTLGEVAKMNRNKLKARYPEGFSSDRSRNRTQ